MLWVIFWRPNDEGLGMVSYCHRGNGVWGWTWNYSWRSACRHRQFSHLRCSHSWRDSDYQNIKAEIVISNCPTTGPGGLLQSPAQRLRLKVCLPLRKNHDSAIEPQARDRHRLGRDVPRGHAPVGCRPASRRVGPRVGRIQIAARDGFGGRLRHRVRCDCLRDVAASR